MSTKTKRHSTKPRSVVLVNTGKEYSSMAEASSEHNTAVSHIHDACNGKFYYSGIEDEEELIWLYKEDYETLSKLRLLEDYKKRTGIRKVYCIELERTFESAKEASEITGISVVTIRRLCKGIPVHEVKFRFLYLDQYNPNYCYKYDESRYVNHGGHHLRKEIIGIIKGTAYRYQSIADATYHTGLHANTISKCLNSKALRTCKLNGFKAIWIEKSKYETLSEETKQEYKNMSLENC